MYRISIFYECSWALFWDAGKSLRQNLIILNHAFKVGLMQYLSRANYFPHTEARPSEYYTQCHMTG